MKKPSKTMVSGHDIAPYLASITKFMEDAGIDLAPYPKVTLSKDKQYAQDPFGKTADYVPEDREVTLFTEGRHIKDVCRSFAHEMIHHHQNLRGDMEPSTVEELDDPYYTQNNKALRELEEEAYLKGNMTFRDWEDHVKSSK